MSKAALLIPTLSQHHIGKADASPSTCAPYDIVIADNQFRILDPDTIQIGIKPEVLKPSIASIVDNEKSINHKVRHRQLENNRL